MPIRLLRAVFAATALIAVAVLTGCGPVIENVTEDQADGVGPVTSSVTVCGIVFDTSDDCAEKGFEAPTIPPFIIRAAERAERANRGIAPEPEIGEQLLLAYRIPNAYAAPESVSAPDAAALTFDRSSSYEEELEAQTPSGDDQKWVGYISNTISYDLDSVVAAPGTADDLTTDPELPDRTRIDARFGVPSGAPALSYRPVVGMRLVTANFNVIPIGAPVPDMPADRPVNCPSASETASEPTVCIASPSSSVKGDDALATNRVFGVRQLELTGAEAPVSVARGGSVDVPFSAVMSGSGSAGGFALTGTSTAPGATVAGGALDLSAPGTTPATVRVTVPRSTSNGSYRVTAIATRGGQTRSASRTLVVGNPLAPSSIGAAGASFAGRMTADGYLPVVITCPKTQSTPCVGTITVDSAGKVTVSAKRKLRLGKGRFRVAPGTRGRQKIKVNRKGRKALRRAGRMRVKATIKGSGRPASVASSSKTFTLRPPK